VNPFPFFRGEEPDGETSSDEVLEISFEDEITVDYEITDGKVFKRMSSGIATKGDLKCGDDGFVVAHWKDGSTYQTLIPNKNIGADSVAEHRPLPLPVPKQTARNGPVKKPACAEVGKKPACAGEAPADVGKQPACAGEAPGTVLKRPSCAAVGKRPACSELALAIIHSSSEGGDAPPLAVSVELAALDDVVAPSESDGGTGGDCRIRVAAGHHGSSTLLVLSPSDKAQVVQVTTNESPHPAKITEHIMKDVLKVVSALRGPLKGQPKAVEWVRTLCRKSKERWLTHYSA